MDTLGNMFSLIQNGQSAHKLFVTCSFSKLKWNLLKIFLIEGYIKGFELKNNKIFIFLKYVDDKGAIRKIARVSSPGKRVYSSLADIGKLKRGLGTLIVSTPKGVLCDRDVRFFKVGGEILCQIF